MTWLSGKLLARGLGIDRSDRFNGKQVLAGVKNAGWNFLQRGKRNEIFARKEKLLNLSPSLSLSLSL